MASRGGESTIIFDQDVLLPKIFYNLTSENEGPTFFNVTLEISEENILNLGLDLALTQRK